ncbi:hypothetical protein CYMTET_21573 [Cymbomonas tetramitiformis]|uniref:Uncharacterized protein n=1 Tax=Cymbomonas tetramitiformis TaxID=36881 RepID=A0AAE0G1X3_9CHLO|nr:hypothetical protein CYMTET_21573 [Cymbomonas tetramitiformis]
MASATSSMRSVRVCSAQTVRKISNVTKQLSARNSMAGASVRSAVFNVNSSRAVSARAVTSPSCSLATLVKTIEDKEMKEDLMDFRVGYEYHHRAQNGPGRWCGARFPHSLATYYLRVRARLWHAQGSTRKVVLSAGTQRKAGKVEAQVLRRLRHAVGLNDCRGGIPDSVNLALDVLLPLGSSLPASLQQVFGRQYIKLLKVNVSTPRRTGNCHS